MSGGDRVLLISIWILIVSIYFKLSQIFEIVKVIAER